MMLRLPNGGVLHLQPQQEHAFGRADVQNISGSKVSRQQFKLVAGRDAVRVVCLSTNPTKVVRAPAAALGGGRAFLLHQGEEAELHAGDHALLLATDPSVFVEVLLPHAAPSSAAEGHTGNAPAIEPSSAAEFRPSSAPDAKLHTEEEDEEHPPPAKRSRVEEETGGADGSSTAAGSGPVVAVAQPVVLILVGVQGSGKSTFCHALLQRSQQQQQPRLWTRINQDSIGASGKRGTREQCLAAARAALQGGSSVLIDRTNINTAQRLPFIQLAQELGVQVHCVALGLPIKTCMDRAAARIDHEGGLQGKGVYAAINMTKGQLELPTEQEGLSSVMMCATDGEVEAALEAWALYGPQHPDPAGEWQRLRPAPKKPNPLATLDRFFQKAPGATVPGSQPPPAGPQIQQQQQQQQQEGSEPARELLSPTPPQPGPAQQKSSQGQPSGSGGNALQVLMAAAKQHAPHPAEQPKQRAAAGAERKKHAFFASAMTNALVGIAEQPERHKGSDHPEAWWDERCVLVHDAYPKARRHALVVARCPRLEGPLDLTADDLPLVEHMQAVGQRWAEEQRAADPTLPEFRLGFHAVPSLRRLHLHVISQDFDSAGLKTKKHWNSFTAEGFFLPASWVAAQLREHGQLDYRPSEREPLLRQDLQCHRCRAPLSNMPKLKAHLAGCRSK